MNERIKQLALQAGGSHYPEVNAMQLEKFAELIVRECVDIVENQGAHMRYNHLAEQIRTHFEIKKR
jgi:hypothetical protein